MLNFPPQVTSRIQRAIDSLRLLAGNDSNGVARPLLTDSSGVLQMALTNWREVYWMMYSGNLAVYTGVYRYYNTTGRSLTFEKIHLAVNTAPTGAAVIVDINVNGTTIFTTQANRPQIAVSAYTGQTTTFNVTTLADGQYLTFDIDQIGSIVTGANLTIQIILG